jgi:hypothetical protein
MCKKTANTYVTAGFTAPVKDGVAGEDGEIGPGRAEVLIMELGSERDTGTETDSGTETDKDRE